MSTDQNNPGEGITRREALKQGAKLTGAILWVTPVVQSVGMSPAFAQVTSPVDRECTVWYAIKIDPSDPDGPCIDIFNQDDPNGVGQCLDVDDLETAPVEGGCDHIVGFTTPSDPDPWTITLDSDCELKACFIKAGNDPCASGECQVDGNTITFPNPGQPEISHVEIAFCCAD